MRTKEIKWENLSDNDVLRGKDFYISYNPNTSAAKGGLGDLWNKLGGIAGALEGVEIETDGRPETALVFKTPTKNIFYILNGDFRKEYETAFSKGFPACKKVYDRNKKEHKSNWSTV